MVISAQYELVKESRSVLFAYCDTIDQRDLLTDLAPFGGRSMGSLLVHITNVYQYWLEEIGLEKKVEFFQAGKIRSMPEIRDAFDGVNDLVTLFTSTFRDSLEVPVRKRVPRRNIELTVTPLKIFTHVISHEFHHKGQILSMSRQLGYTPPDTDMIRF